MGSLLKNVVEIVLVGSYDDQISAKLKKTEQAAQNAYKSMSTAAGELRSAMTGVVLGSGLIGGSIALFVRESIQGEDAIARLNAGLRASDQYTAKTSASLQAYADELQSMTRYSGESIMGVESLFASFGMGEGKIKRTTQATIGLSSALSMDLQSASMLMVKAFEGNAQALSRYGIKIDEGIIGTQALDAVLSAIEGKKWFGIALEDATTFGGSLAMLMNSVSDLAKVVGNALAPELKKAANELRAFSQSDEAIELAAKLGNELRNVTAAVIRFTPEIIDATKSVAGFVEQHKILSAMLFGGYIFRGAIPPLLQFTGHMWKLLGAVGGVSAQIATLEAGAAGLFVATEIAFYRLKKAIDAEVASYNALMQQTGRFEDKFGYPVMLLEKTKAQLEEIRTQLEDSADAEERLGVLQDAYLDAVKELNAEGYSTLEISRSWRDALKLAGIENEKNLTLTQQQRIAAEFLKQTFESLGQTHKANLSDLHKQTLEHQKQVELSDKQVESLQKLHESFAGALTGIDFSAEFEPGIKVVGLSLRHAVQGAFDPEYNASIMAAFGESLSKYVRSSIVQALAQAALSKEAMTPLLAQIAEVGKQIQIGLTPDFTGLRAAMETVRSQFEQYAPLIQTTMQEYAQLDAALQQELGTSWSLIDAKNQETQATNSETEAAIAAAQAIADNASATNEHTAAIATARAELDGTIAAYTVHNGMLIELTGDYRDHSSWLRTHSAETSTDAFELGLHAQELGVARGSLAEFSQAADAAANSLTSFGSQTVYGVKTMDTVIREFSSVQGKNMSYWANLLMSTNDIAGVLAQLKIAYDAQLRALPSTTAGWAQAVALQSEWSQLVSLLNQLAGFLGGGATKAHRGADFIVGGRGGVDQNFVPLRVSRGERVTVTPTSEVNNTQSISPTIVINVYPGAKVDRQMVRDEITPEVLKQLKRRYGMQLVS